MRCFSLKKRCLSQMIKMEEEEEEVAGAVIALADSSSPLRQAWTVTRMAQQLRQACLSCSRNEAP